MGHALINERTILLLIGLVGWLYARITSELRKAAKAREAKRQAESFQPGGVDLAEAARTRRVREEVARRIASRRAAQPPPPPPLPALAEQEPPPVFADLIPVIQDRVGGAAGLPAETFAAGVEADARALSAIAVEQRARDHAFAKTSAEVGALHLPPPVPTQWAVLLRNPASARQSFIVSEIFRSPRERYFY